MAADNTLGAPTEGLGQTVTFAGNSKAGVPQAQAVQRQGVRNNATGGAAMRTAQALQVQAPKGDSFFQTLAKLGGDIIKPMVEAERNLKFYEGVNQAAKSQAIEEIVDEQPWYSKVFGPSSLVDGARAHTASAKATALATELEVDMPNFRKLSDSEAVKLVTDRVTKLASTGDATVNAMIMQQATAAMAPVLKNRTKASINYQQEMRQEATEANYGAQFANLHAVHMAAQQPGSTVDAGDALRTAIGGLSAMVREDGVATELHSKMVASAAMKAAASGNLQAYSVMKASGKFDELTPQDQYQVTRAHAIAVNEAKAKVPVAFLNQQLEYQTLRFGGASPEVVRAKADALNKEWKRLSGDSGDYLTNREVLLEQEQNMATAAQQEEAARQAGLRADTLAGKAQAAADEVRRLAVLASDLTQPVTPLVGKKPQEIADVFNDLRVLYKDHPEQHMMVIAQQAKSLVYDNVMEQMHAGESNTAIQTGNAELMNTYYTTRYLPLVQAAGDQRQVVASHYAGKNKDFMAAYHRARAGFPSELDVAAKQHLFDTAKEGVVATAVGPRATELLAAIQNNTMWGRTKRTVLSEAFSVVDPKGLTDLVMQEDIKNLPADESFESFLRDSPRTTVLGGYHWQKPETATRLDKWLNANKVPGSPGQTDELNQATRLTIDKIVKEAGIDGDGKVFQQADINNVPQFRVFGLGTDGQVKIRYFNATDVNTNWANRKVAPTRVDRGRLPEGEWQATMDKLASKPK